MSESKVTLAAMDMAERAFAERDRLRALLAEAVSVLERAHDAAEDMIDLTSEFAETVGSVVECPGADACAESLCEGGCIEARVSMARDGLRGARSLANKLRGEVG